MFEPIQLVAVFIFGIVVGILIAGVWLSREAKIAIRDTKTQVEISKKLIKEYETSKN